MNKEQKDSKDAFLDKGEKLSDNIVSTFYNDSLVKKIESMEFMKKLINSSFIGAIQDFWKWWFKQVFVFFWYLAIIFWLISLLIDVIDLFGSFRYFRWLLSIILWIVVSWLTVVIWFWMIKFKKWFPFLSLVLYVFQILAYLVFNPYGSMYYSRWDSVGYIIFSVLFFIVWYALILKNKEMFNN